MRGHAITLLLATLPLPQAQAAPSRADFDPASVDLADILGCKIDAGHYLGFTTTIDDEDSPSSAKSRGWTKLASASPFFSRYRLTKPLTVFGYTTQEIAFTGSAMLAVLDLEDAATLGTAQKVTNLLPGPGRFKGERVIDESTEVADGYRIQKSSALQIATDPALPRKTLIGCSYAFDMNQVGPRAR